MRTSNPALSENTFTQFGYGRLGVQTMSVSGTIMKTFILLLLALSTAGYTWGLFFKSGNNPAMVSPFITGGIICGLIAAIATVMKPNWAVVTAPLYAIFEGFVIGGISSVFEAQLPGVVIQAAALTFGTLFVMLFAYQTGVVQATEKFKMGVVAATGAIALIYFLSFIASLFGFHSSMIYSGGLFGILFSLVVVAVAALNLVLDFDFIERGAGRAPQYMEWYGAFALMVTLIWLYMEFLRLLSKLKERN